MSNIQPKDLQALIQRIIDSGELGRSNTYTDILTYLADCVVSGNDPKEMAIAIDVLGRNTKFDVSRDSIVRVHIFHLRNKLKAYFDKYGKQEKFWLEIPKGYYRLTAIPANEVPSNQRSIIGKALKPEVLTQWLGGVAILLLLLNLVFQVSQNESDTSEIPDQEYVNMFLETSPWKEIFDDEVPIVILVGDYYIFGEVNERGEVVRMIREFNVNSPEELTLLQENGVAGADKYFDLSLNYVPSSIAYAITQVMRTLVQGASVERINVKMMSEYSTADLVNNHIIYLGYLSGLNDLYGLMFSGSGLEIGNTYDELNNLSTGDYYISSSGLSGTDSYKDYSMLTTFHSPNGHQVTMIAGMRDEGLTSMAEKITDQTLLAEIQENLDSNVAESNFEALFEVIGFDKTNFSSELIYAQLRDPVSVDGFFGVN
ncbi:MAG: hypothetical protein ACJ0BT_02035 [Pseudohongiellaceae bacterium]